MNSAALLRTSHLLASARGNCRLDLCLHRLKIEARPLLHGREIDQALRSLCDLLLYKSEAPKLVGIPIVKGQRPTIARRQSCSLVGVETQIDEDGPIDLHSGSEPAIRLIGEAILEVVKADGT